jgi:NAD(P)-dependent dehydrogenase (short-subunit alcohol dehydrogenase family)
MPGRLEGKIAIVSGAGSSGPGVGTGKAISILFAEEGAKVLLLDKFEDRAAETLQSIQEAAGTAAPLVLDITAKSG